MATRKLTAVEEQAAHAMAHARLTGGEGPIGVKRAISSWLVARGWKPNGAKSRAGQIVTDLINEISSPQKKPPPASSLYEAWQLPGQNEWQEGEISASEVKTLGAVIKVKSSWRELHVEYESRSGELFPWKLRENQPLGRDGAHDHFVIIGEFSTMTTARAEARGLARGGA